MLSWLYQECWKETLALSNETKGIRTSRKYVTKYIFETSTINRVAQFQLCLKEIFNFKNVSTIYPKFKAHSCVDGHQ